MGYPHWCNLRFGSGTSKGRFPDQPLSFLKQLKIKIRTFCGTLTGVYSPLMAITAICGNRLRTMDSSSNPDMRGRLSSATIKSGWPPVKLEAQRIRRLRQVPRNLACGVFPEHAGGNDCHYPRAERDAET